MVSATSHITFSGRCRERVSTVAGHITGARHREEHYRRPLQARRVSSISGRSSFDKILVANRGEIAIRVCRAAADLGLRTVAIYSEDDARSLHTRAADEAYGLKGRGVPAYLDIEGLIHAAQTTGCHAVHPGYGFLSENPDFARRCHESSLIFIGPKVEMLELFGDKGRARSAALAANVPVMRGIDTAVSLEQAKAFFASLGDGAGMMIKAVAGAGGRGSRAVVNAEEVEAAYERCCSEATTAFGRGEVYVEELMTNARHIEVQVLADEQGSVVSLGERECSLQRRYQKIVEVAPAAHLAPELREEIIAAAIRLARRVQYSNIGTFEFLAQSGTEEGGGRFAFIEANARLQVEHTVTEEVTGVDIVATQIQLAAGSNLQDLGLDRPGIGDPRGRAIQARVNMETLQADGTVRPAGGVLTAYDMPGGPGVRVDGFGYTGYETSPSFDSLLAKVIVHTPSTDLSVAAARTCRALSEFKVEGVATNIPFLQSLLRNATFLEGKAHTRFVDEHLHELLHGIEEPSQRSRFVETSGSAFVASPGTSVKREDGFAGTQMKSTDPLALFGLAKDSRPSVPQLPPVADVGAAVVDKGPPGTVAIQAPLQGTILSLTVSVGDAVQKGQKVAVLESMKMEHDIKAERSGIIRQVTMGQGDIVREGFPLFFLEELHVEGGSSDVVESVDLDFVRPDLALLYERKAYTLDENRPAAVKRRHDRKQRTARENVDDLLDPGTFMEYGPLVLAWQRRRHDLEYLRKNTPGDGVVMGLGTVNGHLFDPQRARVAVVAYDYTVLAGTQGGANHGKQDRMYELCHRERLPLVLYGEGGGGRPGDTDGPAGLGCETTTFTTLSRLSGLVPTVAIVSGFCFAGNTAMAACCDVIICTRNATIAMAGPAMIEGGGLGVYRPEEVGPMSFQVPNGVVDILVEDEEEATAVAKKYISYFQGATKEWTAPDQRKLRHVIPESRVRMYDMRELVQTLCDTDSVLEIRPHFGRSMMTALVRMEGVPMGLIASDPAHLGGAIDSDSADKVARFLTLCNAFDLPVASIMDCPGMMVGPEVEKLALVRHCCRLFNIGANLTVPLFGVVVRKGYGLGVQAMMGGSSRVPFFTVAWPTGEFAGMGIEGAVKLGFRNELMKIEDPTAREAEYNRRVEAAYKAARAVEGGPSFGVDDIIDPADTRKWIVAGLRSMPPEHEGLGWMKRTQRKHWVDTW